MFVTIGLYFLMHHEYSKEKRISIELMAAFYIKSKQILRFNWNSLCTLYRVNNIQWIHIISCLFILWLDVLHFGNYALLWLHDESIRQMKSRERIKFPITLIETDISYSYIAKCGYLSNKCNTIIIICYFYIIIIRNEIKESQQQ